MASSAVFGKEELLSGHTDDFSTMRGIDICHVGLKPGRVAVEALSLGVRSDQRLRVFHFFDDDGV